MRFVDRRQTFCFVFGVSKSGDVFCLVFHDTPVCAHVAVAVAVLLLCALSSDSLNGYSLFIDNRLLYFPTVDYSYVKRHFLSCVARR